MKKGRGGSGDHLGWDGPSPLWGLRQSELSAGHRKLLLLPFSPRQELSWGHTVHGELHCALWKVQEKTLHQFKSCRKPKKKKKEIK